MKKRILLFAAVSAAAWAAPAPPVPRKMAKDLLNVDPQNQVRAIIQWRGAVDDAKEQKVTARGGIVHQRGHAVPMGVYSMTAGALADLANDPDVKYISPDRPIAGKLDLTAAAINASAAWNAGADGTGVGVAVLDSGMNTDPNLGKKNPIVFSYDFTNTNAANQAASALASLVQNSLTGVLAPITNLTAPGPGPGPGGPAGVAAINIKSMNAPDQFGHGQHIGGIIGSNGQASTCPTCSRTFRGMAPGASLINLKVLDQNGQSSDSTVILAIDAAIALKNIYNIRVMNLSLGRPVYESYTQDPLCQAVEAAWKAGITVVVAAGNDGRDNSVGEQGYGTIDAPGNDPYVITVGAMKTEGTATRADDMIATYSSKGPTAIDYIVKPDVVAPGNLMVSLLVNNGTLAKQNPANMVPLSYFQSNLPPGQANKTSPNYFILSGTSMATAVVSGAAADLIDANANLTPDQVKALLMETASKTFPQFSTVTDPTTGQTFTDYYDIFTVGAGYIDVAAAMAAVNSVPANENAMSPTANYDGNTGNVALTFDPASVWYQETVWGTRAVWGYQGVWGTSVLQGNQAVWGTRAVWGYRAAWNTSDDSSDSSVSGTRAVWGTRGAWNTSVDNGTRAAWNTSTESAMDVSISGEP